MEATSTDILTAWHLTEMHLYVCVYVCVCVCVCVCLYVRVYRRRKKRGWYMRYRELEEPALDSNNVSLGGLRCQYIPFPGSKVSYHASGKEKGKDISI